MNSDIRAVFRISANDFQNDEQFLWLKEEIHENKEANKSRFYKEAIVPKVKVAIEGKEPEFNKIMQYIDVLGVDKVLSYIETSTNNKPIREEQIVNIVNQVLQTVQMKGVSISTEQQKEIMTEINKKPSKEQISKLLKLAD